MYNLLKLVILFNLIMKCINASYDSNQRSLSAKISYGDGNKTTIFGGGYDVNIPFDSKREIMKMVFNNIYIYYLLYIISYIYYRVR